MDEHKLIQMISGLMDEKLLPIRNDLATVKGDVEVLKTDVSVLKADVEFLKKDNQSIHQQLKKLDYIAEQVAINAEQRVTVIDLQAKVAEHETDIKMLKKLVTN